MLQERYDRTVEEKWQKRWAADNIYAFDESELTAGCKTQDSRRRTRDPERKTQYPKPIYSIDTPPPFTSGELHMGHVLSYSYFDFAARYKRMRGFNVYYPQGWDTQGFPTEVKVERKYGRLPPQEFREKCIEWTIDMIARMKEQMNQMGFSPDWKYEYRTMEPDYHRKVQLSLLLMYDKKLVYRAEYPVYWCTKCVSAIAKAELDDIQKSGQMHDIGFEGPGGEELTIATTRPELLPACVAVLYHPDDGRYKHLEGQMIRTVLGKEVPVFSDNDVDREFGTGLLMVCTFGDKMDVVWMHRHRLPMVNVIDRHGRMQNAGELNGLKVADAKKKIIERLRNEGKLLSTKELQQTVKVHDRCTTPVELLPSMQWFADIRTIARDIKKLAEQVKWVPEFGITYLIDWVEGAEWDWVISRQRSFGTPLPFYYCEACNRTAAADADKLPFYAEKAGKRKCECGEEMKAEESVCDCWVDSSITPLIIAGWPDDREGMAALYPSSLRPQGVEIVRTWAFYTIYRSGVALTGLPPWKEILLNGNVLAPDGKKMSKSLGNIISPAELLRDYPADSIRQWAALSGAMAKDRPFSYEDIRLSKSFLNKLWNASRFAQPMLDGYVPEEKDRNNMGTIDRWIISRMNHVIAEYTAYMERYEYHHALTMLHSFFWHDFCDNYLEYVKHRVYADGSGGGVGKEGRAGRYCLHYVLKNSIKLLAPIAPHITEEINAELFSTGKKYNSIHLGEWPGHGEREERAERKLETFNSIVAALRQHKAKNKLPQNAVLVRVRLSLPEPLDKELEEELKQISKITEIEAVKGEFNVSVL